MSRKIGQQNNCAGKDFDSLKNSTVLDPVNEADQGHTSAVKF